MSPQKVHQLHLRGGVSGCFDVQNGTTRRAVLQDKGHQPSRSGLLVDHSATDILRNLDTLPQQLQLWDLQRQRGRLRQQEPVELFHGTRTAPKSEVYVQTVKQAARDRDHLLHCSDWAASLRTRSRTTRRTARSLGVPGATTAVDGDGTGNNSDAGAVADQDTEADTSVVVTVVDVLAKMQLVSGSRAFCTADAFETILLDFGLGCVRGLVRALGRVRVCLVCVCSACMWFCVSWSVGTVRRFAACRDDLAFCATGESLGMYCVYVTLCDCFMPMHARAGTTIRWWPLLRGCVRSLPTGSSTSLLCTQCAPTLSNCPCQVMPRPPLQWKTKAQGHHKTQRRP